jgi:hypothetical protein
LGLSIEPVIMVSPVKAIEQAFFGHLMTPFLYLVGSFSTLTYRNRLPSSHTDSLVNAMTDGEMEVRDVVS